MEQRIIEKIMTWTEADRVTLPAWLKSLGVRFTEEGPTTWACVGLVGGISSGFATNNARLDLGPTVGIILAGTLFMQAYPKLLSGLDKALKDEKKSRKL